jgi:GNAT superfamily N-acetyltransferase
MTDHTTAAGEIMAARPHDAGLIATVIAEAFQHLAVAHWLIPQRQDRHAVLRANMMIMVRHALDGHGMADITSDLHGVAVWFVHGTEPLPDPPDYDRRLAEACGEYTANFQVLDRRFAEHHPHHTPHHHLAFMAVVPGSQGRGLGTALLNRHLARFPEVPCYLEASCEESRALYQRHGWRDIGEPFRLPDGTPMWPMWREPVT